MIENELVSETSIDYEEVFRRGGRNHEDEDFALFKCPSCGHVYMLEYEVDTVYLDGNDLSRRVFVFSGSFDCVQCGLTVPNTSHGLVRKRLQNSALPGDSSRRASGHGWQSVDSPRPR